jgi:hypothetical protein
VCASVVFEAVSRKWQEQGRWSFTTTITFCTGLIVVNKLIKEFCETDTSVMGKQSGKKR